MELLGQKEVDQRQRKVLILSQDSFYKVLTAEQKAKALKGQYNFDHPGEAPPAAAGARRRPPALRPVAGAGGSLGGRAGNEERRVTERAFPPPDARWAGRPWAWGWMILKVFSKRSDSVRD